MPISVIVVINRFLVLLVAVRYVFETEIFVGERAQSSTRFLPARGGPFDCRYSVFAFVCLYSLYLSQFQFFIDNHRLSRKNLADVQQRAAVPSRGQRAPRLRNRARVFLVLHRFALSEFATRRGRHSSIRSIRLLFFLVRIRSRDLLRFSL